MKPDRVRGCTLLMGIKILSLEFFLGGSHPAGQGRAFLPARTERKQRSAGEICLGAGRFHPAGKISGGGAKLCIKLFCLLFFSEKSRRSRPGIGTRASENASWCHPISERRSRSLWSPWCGGAAAPVSRPAAGAVLAGPCAVEPFQPWGPSLSGGAPVTHAPSWR